jgi:hypothetical protein
MPVKIPSWDGTMGRLGIPLGELAAEIRFSVSMSEEWKRRRVGYSGTGKRKGQSTREAPTKPPRHSSTPPVFPFSTTGVGLTDRSWIGCGRAELVENGPHPEDNLCLPTFSRAAGER